MHKIILGPSLCQKCKTTNSHYWRLTLTAAHFSGLPALAAPVHQQTCGRTGLRPVAMIGSGNPPTPSSVGVASRIDRHVDRSLGQPGQKQPLCYGAACLCPLLILVVESNAVLNGYFFDKCPQCIAPGLVLRIRRTGKITLSNSRSVLFRDSYISRLK